MQLTLQDHQLTIALSGWERLWTFHLGSTIEIPLSHIQQVTSEKPADRGFNLLDIRAPGTFLPGVIKAGTYYTRNGREFWYVAQDNHYLTLDLQNDYYQKIVLTIEENEAWVNQIHQAKTA